MPNDKPESDPTEDSMAEGEIQGLFMNELETFADDLIYIPGNHDPSTMYNKDRSKLPILSSNVEGNIHRGIYKLRNDLVIIGLGGCVQNKVQHNGEGELEDCWDPFPYRDKDHKEFNEDLDELWGWTMQEHPDPSV